MFLLFCEKWKPKALHIIWTVMIESFETFCIIIALPLPPQSLFISFILFVCVCVFVFSLCYELCEQMACICCFLWFVHLWQTFNELQRLLSKTNGKVVGDLMTPAPLVVHENANLEDAARYSIHLLFNYFFTNCLFINGPVYFLIQKSK